MPAQPNVTLGWQHVPLRCRRARTLLLGPLMPEASGWAGGGGESRAPSPLAQPVKSARPGRQGLPSALCRTPACLLGLLA